ncbi:beta-lactamase/transpeptidase-like protein [Phyllosticta citrichinensis]|uniref:Beta-lactamase/transpeptidase-like protein n=1 Tax=Phyllosticta citrichinensis TaxID=1130410 RepID=A0ABR1XHJ5_9PEZI
MDSFSHTVEAYLNPHTTDSPLPFVTLGAVDKSGAFYYEKFFGSDCSTAAGPQDTNSVHWVAPCSKLVTTIAALQCVEKGVLTLDGYIGDVLPEWKNPKILIGFEENGEPILKPTQSHISLGFSRHMLSRSSGMAYAFLDPLMSKYQDWQGAKPKSNLTIVRTGECGSDRIPTADKGTTKIPSTRFSFSSPERDGDTSQKPNMSACWSVSHDPVPWTLQLNDAQVERVNGGIKLGEYMRRNIFEPLGIKDMTFHLEDREDMRKRLARMWQRTPDGGLQMRNDWFMPDPVFDDFGGTGLYATAPELLKIYAALLRDDERLLRKETVDLMFTPHIPTTVDFDDARKASVFVRNSVFNSIPDDAAANSGLGGVLNTTAVPGRRGAPSLTWSGMSNCFWWIDSKSRKLDEGSLKATGLQRRLAMRSGIVD